MDSNKLRGKMAEAGISQRELARITGMTPQSMCRKLSGRRQFTVGEALAICQALDIKEGERAKIFLPEKSHTCNV